VVSRPHTKFSVKSRKRQPGVIHREIRPAWADSPWEEKYALGFTLIEVLMAAAILAIGLMAVASLITRSFVLDARASQLSRGTLLLEDYLENATRAQYFVNDFKSLADTSESRAIDGVRYTLNCTMADNTPIERCKEMTCILSWNNRGSRASARYVYVLSPKF
jgi:prepilin-type N-terminal cleavage/methylation domain-containing protein